MKAESAKLQQFSLCGVDLWSAGCGASGSAGSRKLHAQADQRFSPFLLKMRIAGKVECKAGWLVLRELGLGLYSLRYMCKTTLRAERHSVQQFCSVKLAWALKTG